MSPHRLVFVYSGVGDSEAQTAVDRHYCAGNPLSAGEILDGFGYFCPGAEASEGVCWGERLKPAEGFLISGKSSALVEFGEDAARSHT
jgi:hypothetical protein